MTQNQKTALKILLANYQKAQDFRSTGQPQTADRLINKIAAAIDKYPILAAPFLTATKTNSFE